MAENGDLSSTDEIVVISDDEDDNYGQTISDDLVLEELLYDDLIEEPVENINQKSDPQDDETLFFPHFPNEGSNSSPLKSEDTLEKKYQCSFCGRAYASRSSYRRHARNHTRSVIYHCDFCTKTFTRSDNLRQHLKIHFNVKVHECHLCDRTFVQKGNLNAHVRTHIGIRDFKCDICQRTFLHGSDLKSHMILHTGEYKHWCDICMKGFIRPKDLRRHQIKHMAEDMASDPTLGNGESPFDIENITYEPLREDHDIFSYNGLS